MEFHNTREFALGLDQTDPLAGFRERFAIPPHEGGETIYFCGNSLGLMPLATRRAVSDEIEAWAALAVGGHFKEKHPWYTYHEELRDAGSAIVGARPEEVAYMNGLTVNLNLLLVSFFRPRGNRTKILIEAGAFPSDLYTVQSQLRFHGLDPADHLIQVRPAQPGGAVSEPEILEAIEHNRDRLALVMLGAINFFTGRLFDIRTITGAAHAAGCPVGFDLAHSAGNVLHSLHDDDVDFAVWCTYKYLNSGPGAVAGSFVHCRHHNDRDLPQFAGWWGNDPATRFEMNTVRDFVPVASADRWQLSNPPILAMAPVRESLLLFAEAGMQNLRRKSIALTDFLEFVIGDLDIRGASILTPPDPDQRGCQLSVRVETNASDLYRTLTRAGVIVDFREPDVIRVAPAPLYNSFMDVWRFGEILKRHACSVNA